MSDGVYEILSQREVGRLSISLGTSFAIEALCGLGEGVVKPPIYDYKLILVNVRTLIRNCLNALKSKDVERLDAHALASVIVEEWQIIQSAVVKLHKVQLVPYIPTYEDLERRFPDAIILAPNTPKQQLHYNLEVSTSILLMSAGLIEGLVHVVSTFDSFKGKTLILTHSPVDLLQRYQFSSLELLESHTGKIKSPSQWGSKLQGKDNHRLPLNTFTLQVFGDGYKFRPQPLVARRAVHATAQLHQWTPTTTLSKIRTNITNAVKENDIRELLLKFIH